MTNTAADIMTRDVIAIAETAAIPEVADLLTKNRIKHVPVMRDGIVAGYWQEARNLHRCVRPSHPW